MPASKQGKVLVACPQCGNEQLEPSTAFSTVCKKCRKHFHVQEILHPVRAVEERQLARKQITCFDCGAELQVAISAESTMCKRCGRHVDLRDYRIANAVSKNFKTKGAFIVEQKGYVFNTEVVAGEAVIKGRFHGKLDIEGPLTIYSTAEIKGSFKTGNLIIPANNHFRWNEPIKVKAAEISGEIAADIVAGTVILKSTARMFGNLEAKNLTVEEGAVVVGDLRIGTR